MEATKSKKSQIYKKLNWAGENIKKYRKAQKSNIANSVVENYPNATLFFVKYVPPGVPKRTVKVTMR